MVGLHNILIWFAKTKFFKPKYLTKVLIWCRATVPDVWINSKCETCWFYVFQILNIFLSYILNRILHYYCTFLQCRTALYQTGIATAVPIESTSLIWFWASQPTLWAIGKFHLLYIIRTSGILLVFQQTDSENQLKETTYWKSN